MKSEDAFTEYYSILHGGFTHLLTSTASDVYLHEMYEQAMSFYEFIHEFSVRLREAEAERCNALYSMRAQLQELYAPHFVTAGTRA